MCIDVNELRSLSTEAQRKQAEDIILGLPDQLKEAALTGSREASIKIWNDDMAELVRRHCRRVGLRTKRRGRSWFSSGIDAPSLQISW